MTTIEIDIMLPVHSRRFMAIQLRAQHPDWSLGDIANQLECSRQRIYSILKKANMNTVKTISLRHCRQCKKHMYHKGFCSDECRVKFKFDKYYMYVLCGACNNPIKKRRANYKYALNVLKQKHFYCSKICYIEGRRLYREPTS